MLAGLYELGYKFAKMGSALNIGSTDDVILKKAKGLANFASLCQKNGLVPIVESKILEDENSHSAKKYC